MIKFQLLTLKWLGLSRSKHYTLTRQKAMIIYAKILNLQPFIIHKIIDL